MNAETHTPNKNLPEDLASEVRTASGEEVKTITTPPVDTVPPAAGKQIPYWRRPYFLVGVGAIVLLAWQWLDTRAQIGALQQELAKRLGAGDAVANQSRDLSQQNHRTLIELSEKVESLESELNETQGQRDALETMYQELSRGRDERILAETEQAVAIAAQQLQLAGNVEPALIALQSAEGRLARQGGAQFVPVRRLLVRDIERLKALPLADVSGMAVRLEGVTATIDALPLAYTQRPPKNTSTGKLSAAERADSAYWQLLLADFWQELRQLVRIEHMDQPAPALLAPSQVLFLRENLRLRLVNARLSLLQRDGRSFREDLQQAQHWLDLYFDTRTPAVQTARDTLQRLSVVNLNLELPSLNETLLALRNTKLSRDKK